MGVEHHYEPCFAQVPFDSTERWTLLREFVSRWHNLPLSLWRDCELAARDAEYLLHRQLPNSIREWIALSQDLMAIDAFQQVFRDCYEVSRLNRWSATTLMIQGEGDVYWAVQDRYFDVPDPPVDAYLRDNDSPRFFHNGQESRSLTSFALGHMAYFLGVGFVRTLNIDEHLLAELRDSFPVAAQFDELHVFERVDLIAFVRQRSAGQYTLIVARKGGLKESEMPECIRRMAP